MKNLVLLLFICLTTLSFAQSENGQKAYNVFKNFRCDNCTYRYFVSSNAGVLNTPLGYKIGIFGKTGAYLGARFGSGKIRNWETDSVAYTTLFSVTGGLIKPLYTNNNFSLHAYFGAGYGEWFNNRRDGWASSGYEIETGLMLSYKRIVLSLGGTVLDGSRSYPKWDGTVGLGVRF